MSHIGKCFANLRVCGLNEAERNREKYHVVENLEASSLPIDFRLILTNFPCIIVEPVLIPDGYLLLIQPVLG